MQQRPGNTFLLAYGLLEFGATQKNEQDVSHFIKQWLEANAVKAREVFFSISDPEGVLIKMLDLAKIPLEAEPLYAAKEQIQEQLRINLEEYVWDFQVIHEYADGQGGKRIKVICVFVKKNIISKYLQVVKACGLVPKRVSTSAFNHGQTLGAIPENPAASAVLDIAGTHSDLAIYQDAKLNLVRNFEFCAEKLRSALIGVIATQKGRIEVNLQQAKELLIRHGIPPDPLMDLEYGIQGKDISLLLQPLLKKLSQDLSKACAEFKEENGREVSCLYLTGGGANLKGLDLFLAQQLKIKVAPLPVPKSLVLKVDRQEFSLAANQLCGVLGLSLAAAGINLLPFKIKPPKSKLVALIEILFLVWLLIFLVSLILIRGQKPVADPADIAKPQPDGVLNRQVNNANAPSSGKEDPAADQPVGRQEGQLGLLPAGDDQSSKIMLTGIFWDAKNPLAIINGKIVGLGQPVGGKKVAGIKRDRVILSDGQETLEIKLKERFSW